MMSFGALKYFGSVIKKLKKIIVPYQPRDLHLCFIFCPEKMNILNEFIFSKPFGVHRETNSTWY